MEPQPSCSYHEVQSDDDDDAESPAERSVRGFDASPRRYFVHAMLLMSVVALGAMAQQYFPDARPQGPPLRLLQGCTPQLLHSRAFRQVQVLCRTQPALAVVAFEGIKDALAQCEERLRFHAWDCSKIGHPLLDEPMLRYGHREAALIWALTSAGAAWGIATACNEGWLHDCACTPTPAENSWEWSGCSYGVQFTVTRYSTAWRCRVEYSTAEVQPSIDRLLTLDLRRARDDDDEAAVLRARRGERLPLTARTAERHNLKTGRLVSRPKCRRIWQAIKKTAQQTCRCHGVSGSCQQKTCWRKAADIESISAYLIDKYHRAKIINGERKVRNSELLVIEPSPDHCSIAPVTNRICALRNETHSMGDCPSLCCGKGYNVTHEVIPYKCECRIISCCSVECNECLQHRWISKCL